LDYLIKNISGSSRTSILKLNNKIIKAPINWYAFSNIESKEFQLNAFMKSSIGSFLCNVYDLKFNDKKNNRLELMHTLKQFGFNSKCDSGGFQAMTKGVELTQEEVALYQTKLGCDLNIQLDYPLTLDITNKEAKSRIDYNLSNLKFLVKNYSKNNNFIPTIHGHTPELIEYSINKIKKILGRNPEIVAIGSLVPLSLNANIEKKKRIVDILLYVRNKLPKSFIHALGMGGSMTYIGVYCGLDSFDSAGWAQKSGYGVVQLPGVSDRYIERTNNGRRALNKEEFIQFLDCDCPACKYYTDKIIDFQGKGTEKRLLRAIHNLHLFNSEMIKMRKAINNDFIEDFIIDRLRNSKWLPLIKYAKNKLQNPEKTTMDSFI